MAEAGGKTRLQIDTQTPTDVEFASPATSLSTVRFGPQTPPPRPKKLTTGRVTEPDTLKFQTEVMPRDAWMSVFGSWIILFASAGYLYAYGVYQDFYVRIYLRNYSPSSIGWIGSSQIALSFTLAILSGKLYDMGHGRKIITMGSMLFLFSLFMLSLAKEGIFYQIFLSQGLGMGIGVGLVFAPCMSAVRVQFRNSPNHFLASGIAMSGSSFGSLVYPIVINQLLPRLGFASTVRATAYLASGLLIIGNLCIRIAKRKPGPPPEIKEFFKEPAYVLYLLGCCIGALGCYFPVSYIQLYIVEKNIDANFAFYSVSLINGLGIPTRILVGLFAQKSDLWISCTFVTVVLAIGGWAILGLKSTGPLVVVCIIYGIALGTSTSLNVAMAGQLAKNPQEVGARLNLALFLMSPFLLGSTPAQGALLTSELYWNRPIIFSAAMASASAGFFFVGRLYIATQRATRIV